jgi:hypothetical protein
MRRARVRVSPPPPTEAGHLTCLFAFPEHPPGGLGPRWVRDGLGVGVLEPLGELLELVREQVPVAVQRHRRRGVAELGLGRLPTHVAELVRAAWELGDRPELDGLRLRPWAHMLGFRATGRPRAAATRPPSPSSASPSIQGARKLLRCARPARAADGRFADETLEILHLSSIPSGADSMRKAASILGLALGLFFIVRAVAEPFTIDMSDPATYRNDWGGPSLIGVLLVHMGPGVIAAVVIAMLLIRRSSRRAQREQR